MARSSRQKCLCHGHLPGDVCSKHLKAIWTHDRPCGFCRFLEARETNNTWTPGVHVSGGQNYLLLVMDMAKVGGLPWYV